MQGKLSIWGWREAATLMTSKSWLSPAVRRWPTAPRSQDVAAEAELLPRSVKISRFVLLTFRHPCLGS